MRIHTAKRVLSLKVVYYGCGRSGKTTNLTFLHQHFSEDQRGALVQLDTETERTIFFDYCPVVIGRIGGFRVKVDFFTVPGQSFYKNTRQVVLQGADGVVFVADSHPNREEANLQSREDLQEALSQMPHTPLVYQWNKRDLKHAISKQVLERTLNPERAPSSTAVASTGQGVMFTHQLVLNEVLTNVKKIIASRTNHKRKRNNRPPS